MTKIFNHGITEIAILFSIITLPIVCAGQGTSFDDGQSFLRGKALDTNGLPVANALVLPLPHGGEPIETNEDGMFELLGPSKKRRIEWILARHLGRNIAGVFALSDSNGLINVQLKHSITLQGCVTDPNGKPIRGAKLRPYIHIGRLSAGFGYTAWPESDAEGTFEVRTLPVWPVTCSYGVSISADGYGYTLAPEMLSVTSGIKDLGKVMLQPAVHSLEGIVFDEQDKPVQNATVSASGKGQPFRRVKTDNEGRFQIKGVCKGQVSLHAKASSGASGSDCVDVDSNSIEIYIRPTLACMLPPKSPPLPLLNKPLPNLSQLQLPIEAKNKPVLLCFIRLEQLSSKYCVRQLSKNYDNLNNKGISILAVQTWPFNKLQVERWKKRNGIQFPITILQNEFMKAPEKRVTHIFGVQNRVPWLILTNEESIVNYEGFAIEDLNNRIEEISKRNSNMRINSDR